MVDQLIARIEARNKYLAHREGNLFVDLSVRYKLNVPSEELYTEGDPEGNGYYEMAGDGTVSFHMNTGPIMGGTRTYGVDVDVKADSECRFSGMLSEDCVFIMRSDDGDYYVNVRGKGTPLMDFKFFVPAGTKRILYSADAYLGSPEPSITLENMREVDVTRYVVNWRDLDAKNSRSSLTGVIFDITVPIEFCSVAKTLLSHIFNEKMLTAYAYFKVYKRHPKNNTYKLLKDVALDFRTYEETKTKVSIKASDTTIQDCIKSNGSTKFNIPVADVKSSTWNYDRIGMLSYATWDLPVGDYFPTISRAYKTVPTMSLSDSYLPESNTQCVPINQNYEDGVNPTTGHFIEILDQPESESSAVPFTGKFNFRAEIYTHSILDGDSFHLDFIAIYDGLPSLTPIKRWTFTRKDDTTFELSVDEKITLFGYQRSNIQLRVVYEGDHSNDPYTYKMRFTEYKDFTLEWLNYDTPVDIDVVDPSTLLNRMLNDLSNAKGRFKGFIDWEEPYRPMLCAAESIRGFDNAQIHTSIKDFIDWMNVKGYTYTFSGNLMFFKKRYRFFKRNDVIMELGVSDTRNIRVTADGDFAYTSVEIGYKKKDYGEEVDGRLEFNGTLDFATGLIDLREKKLSLISPYRADPIGVESLCRKRKDSNKNASSNSDNDLFEIAMTQDAKAVYSDVTATAGQSVMFNAVLSPVHLVKANEDMIGISTDKLRFAGTDSNRDVVFSDGTIIGRDIYITKQLLKPVQYSFDCGHLAILPEEGVRDGIIRFKYKDKMYEGFIKEIIVSCAFNKATEWTLYAL